jgi:probable rRNA maturation factor
MKKLSKTKAHQPASPPVKLSAKQPTLQLSVQFAVPAQDLTRQQIRSWVKRAVDSAWQTYALNAQGLLLNLRFVDLTEGQALNTQFRHKPKATNVLTFDYGLQEDNVLSADVIICVPVLVQEAKTQNKLFNHHAAHLIVHGTLHALGFDHVEDNAAHEMETLETAILAQMKIADPYLIST